jgi:hypothetical protein
MPPSRLTLLLATAALASDAPAPLRVIRVTPTDDATPSSVITVTFDRPVAGSLDRSVDPRSVLTLQPALAGTWDWRDPVTVRLLPASPLPAGLTLEATVRAGFSAMDGSTLSAPHQWSLRVRGPKLLGGLPAGPGQTARFLPPEARFQLVTPLPPDAPWQFKEAGGWERDRSVRWPIATYGPFELLEAGCQGLSFCPTSPIELRLKAFGTTGYRPSVSYVDGRTTVERIGRRTLGKSWTEVVIEVKGQ